MTPAANGCMSPCTGSHSCHPPPGAALDAHARHEHLYSPKGEGEELHSIQRKFLPIVIGYVIAILVGLALPAVAVALYFGLGVYLVVPFREVRRLVFQRS
jgi:hypothetical protein